MSVRLAAPRHVSRFLLPSIRHPQSRAIPQCLRLMSVSAHESESPIVRSPPPASPLRETKRPETLHPPPAPPRTETPSANSMTSSSAASSPQPLSALTSKQQVTSSTSSKKEPKFSFKPLKAALTLTPRAVSRLKEMLDQPEPKLVRVGVKNRGCAGLAYHLEYVEKPGKFDEIVEQDDVKVLIDSRALFSIIGSTMDFVEDRLSARFVFDNPHVKGSCGCGESFSIS